MAVLVPQIGTIFLLSPGTGSTSLSAWFIDELGAEWVFPNNEHKHATPELLTREGLDLSRYIVVTTTRNPFDFYISQYHKKRTWKGESADFQLAKRNPFPVFLEKFLERTPDGVLHPTFLNAADVVLRKECLEDDVNALLRHLGVDKQARLPQLNVATDLSHALDDWYTPADLQRVRDKHAEHLQRFGYASAEFLPERPLLLDEQALQRKVMHPNGDAHHSVMPGKQGWLYLSDASNDVIKCTTGTYDSTQHWLNAWHEEIIARQQAAHTSRHGSATYVVPNTHSALPQYLPDAVTLAAERPITRLLDAVPAIHYPLSALRDEACFIRNDSHYSEFGAYQMYRYICQQHGLGAVDIPRKDFTAQREIGDLGAKLFPALMGSRESLSPDAKQALGLLDVQSRFNSEVRVTGRFEVRHNPRALSDETLLLFGDSYSYRLLQFFNLNFRTVVFLHSSCPPLELIAATQADLVLFVHAERFMHQQPSRQLGAHRDNYLNKLKAQVAAGIHNAPPSYSLDDVAGLEWLIGEIIALENHYDSLYPNQTLNFGKLHRLGELLLNRRLGSAELIDKCRRHPTLQSALLELVNSEEFALKNGRPQCLQPHADTASAPLAG